MLSREHPLAGTRPQARAPGGGKHPGEQQQPERVAEQVVVAHAAQRVGQLDHQVPGAGQQQPLHGGPDVAGDLYGYGLTVGAKSANPAEAWKFVAMLASHGTDYFQKAEGLFIGDAETAEGGAADLRRDGLRGR